MRVFLSHSSKDKGFVEAVAEQLKPGTFELDSLTFDAGLINSQAIVSALSRSDLFCLFLSRDSINSTYVDFETLLGLEFVAKGRIHRFLAVCLDEDSFSQASSAVKFFNVVRRGVSVESVVRLIQGSLVAASVTVAEDGHPFIGREAQLRDLEAQVIDPARPNTKALFISGNFGAGRRTVARNFYRNQYPHVGSIFPEIPIDEFSGLEELYRKILGRLRPSISVSELKVRVQAFSIATQEGKRQLVADLLNSVLVAKEAVFLVDIGGVLADSGGLEPEVDSIVGLLEARPHPPVALITTRMTPYRFRRAQKDIAYLAVPSLPRDDANRLLARLLKNAGISYTQDEADHLLILADGHPFNFYRILEEASRKTIPVFLANPSEFIEWKHRQSSEYVGSVDLTETDVLVLSALNMVPVLDLASIVDSMAVSADLVAASLEALVDQHIVEVAGGGFMISPPVRIAVERDRRVHITAAQRSVALKTIAETLVVRIDEGSATLDLVDSAIMATLESGAESNSLVSAFLLPSHYVWLAQRHYDQRQFTESIRLAKEALKSKDRLSLSGFVAACRFLCLAAARMGETDTFNQGIALLTKSAHGDLAKSNVEFLQGFHARMQGNLPIAEAHFRASYELSPGNISTAREIAAICLARGNLDEAEKFAREARGYASRNPYLIDILISVLIRKLGRKAKADPEVREMFDALEEVGEEDGRSFYTTRRAELEHLWGDNRVAKTLIEEAITKTPTIFEARRLYCEILLKDGNKAKASEVIEWMRAKVESREISERRSNFRAYLETYSHYLAEIGQFKEAKEIYNDPTVFTSAEKARAIRDIEIGQSYKQGH